MEVSKSGRDAGTVTVRAACSHSSCGSPPAAYEYSCTHGIFVLYASEVACVLARMTAREKKHKAEKTPALFETRTVVYRWRSAV